MVCWVMSARCIENVTLMRFSGCAAMKRAVFFGAILGCLVLFACGAGLCSFLLMTYWLAPTHVSFQRELFFDYTQSEAVASAQLCPAISTQVRKCLGDTFTEGLPT